MYRVLIADDEDIIRRGLASMVGQYDRLEVVALAEDGEIALEQAEQTRPDLMLVDINMPFLDGFEFIQAAKKLLPDVEIVIITGYDDFAFVQKALQVSAADYLLKPIMEEPFFKVLDKAVNRLDGKEKAKKYMNWLTNQMEQNHPSLVNDFFRNWLRSSLDQVEIEDRMQYLNIEIPTPYWVTLLHLRSDPDQEASLTDWNMELLLYGCDNIAHEIFTPSCPILTFRTEGDALAIISRVLPQQQWEELSQKLIEPIESYLRVKAELVRYQGNSLIEFPEVVERALAEYKARRKYSEAVTSVLSMIEKQWGNSEFSLQSAADQLYVTPQYLSRIFHRETGDTFGTYLTGKRIKEAMRLLQDQNLKMYEIAQRTGYSSQHYFSSAFKRVLGISPVEYRKNILEQGGTK